MASNGTWSGFFKELNKDISKASKKIGKKLEFEVKEQINEMVYDSYSPKFYQRTYQLLYSVENKVDKIKNGSEIHVFHNTGLIDYNEPFTHGSPLWGDASDIIPYIIHEGKGGSLFGLDNPTRKARPYMKDINKRLKNGWLSQLFIIEMKLLGYKAKK